MYKNIKSITTGKELAENSLNQLREIEANRIKNLPSAFILHRFLDWGDYSTTLERRIIEIKKDGEYCLLETVLNLDKVEDKNVFNLFDKYFEEGIPVKNVSNYRNDLDMHRSLSKSDKNTLLEMYKDSERERIAKEKKESALKEKAKEKKDKENAAKLKDAFENDLMIFGNDILSSTNFSLVHTIGAVFHKEQKMISVYSTSYCKDFKRCGKEYTDTYHAKEELKAIGAQWQSSSWTIHWSLENEKEVIRIMKKYDTKEEPHKLGLSQCWECGTYSRHLDNSGYCGC